LQLLIDAQLKKTADFARNFAAALARHEVNDVFSVMNSAALP
jgi:hypothetical protein